MFRTKFNDSKGFYIAHEGTWWSLNGELHREDGPAIEYSTGEKLWYKKGLLHNSLGPAITQDGEKGWYLNGIRMVWKAWCLKTALDLYDT